MNEIQLTNHLTAQFMASTISRYEAEIRERLAHLGETQR